MKQKSSKVQAEMVMGKYLDFPMKRAKKHEKHAIKRKRRVLEKREAINEIEFETNLHHVNKTSSLCSHCLEPVAIPGRSICEGCETSMKEEEGLDFVLSELDSQSPTIRISSDIEIKLA